jgi:UDP-N-acetylmuramoyl-tripeptide--D-alanyl-D-alanine ligase
MKPIYLQEILTTIGGAVISGVPNPFFIHVQKKTDSSFWKDHTLFFHIKEKKAVHVNSGLKSIVIITKNPQNIINNGSEVTVVKVENCKKAYWDFVQYYRNLFDIPFISITGTCGKTTTKEMLGWILHHDRKVNKTNRSQNVLALNLKYLLKVDESTDVTIIESAVASVGHLEASCRYFKPQIGVLTSIGIDHLNGFRSYSSYMREKAKIFACVGEKGTVVANGDDVNIKKIDLSWFKGRTIWYGKSQHANFRISEIKYSVDGMNFVLNHNGIMHPMFVPGYGEHNVYNAVAAIAVAYELGVSVEESRRRLKTFKHMERHIEVSRGIKESILIDDTWSTNPTSIKSAIDVLTNISKGKKKIAVLGEIKWLGNYTTKAHLNVGEMVAKHNVDILITIGKNAELIAQRAIECGLNPNNVFPCHTPKDAFLKIYKIIDENSVVLVKTSMKQSFSKFISLLKEGRS